MTDQPSGAVTFLFTDVVGSTRRWAHEPVAMEVDMTRHDEIVSSLIVGSRGHVFSRAGDSYAAAFTSPSTAVSAALAIQEALGAEVWAGTEPLLVRVGIHTGEAVERAGDYFGPPVNLAARIMSVASGGQILISQTTLELGSIGGNDLGRHRLRDIDERVRLFQVGDGTFPALASENRYITTLPRQRTSFVGRDDQKSQLKHLLTSSPLVTITGPGGVGKTRLAIEVAAEGLAAHPDGVFFVDLASTSDADSVPSAIVSGLGLRFGEAEDHVRTVLAFIRDRQVLIVLDNCEHVIDAVADVADELLANAPTVSLLATSREPLLIGGEATFGLTPLGAESSDSPAVRLFVQRAIAANAQLGLASGEIEHALAICQRLDGIPLAIELAAARTSSMSLADIASNLNHRFELLIGGGRSRRPRRQQALQTTIEWSYDLLTDAAQAGFRSLSVFESWFLADDADAVLASRFPTREILDELVTKSLLTMTTTPTGATSYRYLESVREFARSLLLSLGEAEGARRRYERHLIEWLTQVPIAEQDTNTAIERVTLAWPDVTMVAESVDPEDRLRILGGLGQGLVEPDRVIGWHKDARDAETQLDDRERAAALRVTAAALFYVAKHDEVSNLIETSGLTMENATNEEAFCFASCTCLVTSFTHPEHAHDIGCQMIEAADRIRNSGYVAPTGGMVMAWSLLRLGRFEEAAEAAMQWLPLAPPGGITYTALSLVAAGGYDLAGRPGDVARIAADWNHQWELSIFGGNVDLVNALGLAATHGVPAALGNLAESARLRADGRRPEHLATYLVGFGRLHWLDGNLDRADELLRITQVPGAYSEVVAMAYHQHRGGWPKSEFRNRLVHLDRSNGLTTGEARDLIVEEANTHS